MVVAADLSFGLSLGRRAAGLERLEGMVRDIVGCEGCVRWECGGEKRREGF